MSSRSARIRTWLATRWRSRLLSGAVFVLVVSATAFVTGIAQIATGAVTRSLGLADDGPALRVSSGYDWLGEDAEVFVFSAPLSKLDRHRISEMNTGNMQRLLASIGGVQVALPDWRGGRFATFTRIKVVVQNRASTPVVLIGIRARVELRGAPLRAAQVALLPQGDETVSPIALNLDSSDPIARVAGAHETIGAPYFTSRDVSLAKNESVVFEIQAYTRHQYVEWRLAINAVVDGKSRSLQADDDGLPFRSSALAPSYAASYQYDYRTQKFVVGLPLPYAPRP